MRRAARRLGSSAARRLGGSAALAVAMVALLAACGRGTETKKPAAAGAKTAFSAEAAMRYAQAQLAFGSRVPGSPAHRQAGDWIVAEMRKRADTVLVQEWTHKTVAGETLPLRNILARYRPDAAQRVLYVTHWDSRPISDEAEDPARQTIPVPGANDGASGVGLLVALGDVLKQTPPNVGVDLLFVDGEDYGDFTAGKDQDVLLGSRYFAKNLPSPNYRPLFGVLWDMIGDKDLQIFQEANSVQRAREVVGRIWDVAGDLGYGQYFVRQVGQTITDDHIPLLDAGLHVADVIDIDYPYHHTPDDTFDKISKESLQAVGDVAVKLITSL